MEQKTAYFDNAATTFPKPEIVYEYADSFYRSSGGNIGRGGNALAVAAGEVARQAKENLRALYGCPTREVVFTSSATDALNRILFGLGVEPNAHVYLSPFEHNAVTRPLNHLAKIQGVQLHVLPFSRISFLPDMAAIKAAFEAERPRLVVLTHASNVCGAVVPVEEIFALAKQYDATTVVDMSQTAGLLGIDLTGPNIDFAVFAGHKTLYGPFGVGGFLCKSGTRLNPVLFGGNGINSIEQDMPENIVQMEEVGSQNTYAIAGLKASTDWIIEQGMANMHSRESYAKDELLKHLEDCGARVIGRDMECVRIGVVSALFDGYSSDEIEMVLGRYGIAVRSGIQCAPYAHSFLGTLPGGTVRFSVSALTSVQDFSLLSDALGIIKDS